MKHLKRFNEKGVISFDFDGTLHKSMISDTGYPINHDLPNTWSQTKTPTELVRKLSKNYKIIIVTHRHEDQKEFIEEYIKLHKLPITEIFCCQLKDGLTITKASILKKEHVIVHFDDTKNYRKDIENSGVYFILYDFHKDEFYKYKNKKNKYKKIKNILEFLTYKLNIII